MALLEILFFLTLTACGLVLAATIFLGIALLLRPVEADEFRRGARRIFDADEPVGRTTDRFPRGRRGSAPEPAWNSYIDESAPPPAGRRGARPRRNARPARRRGKLSAADRFPDRWRDAGR